MRLVARSGTGRCGGTARISRDARFRKHGERSRRSRRHQPRLFRVRRLRRDAGAGGREPGRTGAFAGDGSVALGPAGRGARARRGDRSDLRGPARRPLCATPALRRSAARCRDGTGNTARGCFFRASLCAHSRARHRRRLLRHVAECRRDPAGGRARAAATRVAARRRHPRRRHGSTAGCVARCVRRMGAQLSRDRRPDARARRSRRVRSTAAPASCTHTGGRCAAAALVVVPVARLAGRRQLRVRRRRNGAHDLRRAVAMLVGREASVGQFAIHTVVGLFAGRLGTGGAQAARCRLSRAVGRGERSGARRSDRMRRPRVELAMLLAGIAPGAVYPC